jgi:adenosylmethionine-8-amino-7-oxononanoate aminotransferase
MTAGKGTTGGYVPFGYAAASAAVYDAVATTGFVHGFTWSHNALGAAAGRAVLQLLHEEDLVARSAALGDRIRDELRAELADCPIVGDIRGLGTMIGIELVRDAATKEPFARTARVTERAVAHARDHELLVYSSTGHVDGVDGDLVVLGPPFVLTDDDEAILVERTAAAIRSVA